MANAMLEDDFKSSHPDLTSFNNPEPQMIDKKANLPTRKSVDFAILPPPKRPKQDALWTAKQIVDGAYQR
jgi:hypothetical protein